MATIYVHTLEAMRKEFRFYTKPSGVKTQVDLAPKSVYFICKAADNLRVALQTTNGDNPLSKDIVLTLAQVNQIPTSRDVEYVVVDESVAEAHVVLHRGSINRLGSTSDLVTQDPLNVTETETTVIEIIGVASNGTDGASAYDIWLSLGNTGTEEDFIDSLHGAPGDITAGVASVNGETGHITLTKSYVGLSNVDNTSDANKPVSTAQATAIALKAPLSHTHAIADITSLQAALDAKVSSSDLTTALTAKEDTITAGTTAQYWRGDKSWATLNKAAVGLSNVNNTADTDKPISTAQQTALDAKADSAHTHSIANVSGLQAALDAKAASSHSHIISDVTGLQASLDAKLDDSQATATGLSVLGASNAAALTALVNTFTTSLKGLVPAPTTATGKFLKDDGTWAVPASDAGSVDWGAIEGTLSDQTDLQSALDAKAASTHSHAIADVTGLQAALDALQPLDPQLTSLAGLTFTSNGSKVVRINSGATAFEVAALVKGDVGLGNVDNTADTAKPVSTAQQTALDAKQGLDATLTALAALNSTAGLLEQTGADTFTKRAIGVASSTDILTRADGDTRFASASHNHDSVYQPKREAMMGFCSGKPAASEVVAGGDAPAAFTISSSNCRATAGTAATASTVFTIKNGGSTVGTFTFAASGTTATVSITGSTSVSANDRLTITAPSSADATCADINFRVSS